MMKRRFSLIILLLGVFLLSGCTNLNKEDKSTEIILISDEIIDKIAATSTLILKEKQDIKTITDINKVEKVINLIASSTSINHDITYEGPIDNLELYNANNQLIDIIRIFDNSISFDSDQTNRYKVNIKELKEIIIE